MDYLVFSASLTTIPTSIKALYHFQGITTVTVADCPGLKTKTSGFLVFGLTYGLKVIFSHNFALG